MMPETIWWKTNAQMILVLAWCFHWKRETHSKKSAFYFFVTQRLSPAANPDPEAASRFNQIWPCLSSEMVSLLYQIPRSDCPHHKISNKISLLLLLSGYVCQTVLWGEAFECYPCEFDIFSERSKISGSELQGNYCDASCLTVKLIRAEKPCLYLLSIFPVGLIACKWKTRVRVLLLGVNTSVWFASFHLVLNSTVLVTRVSRSHKCTAAARSLLLASLCEIYSGETLVEWKMDVIVSVRGSSRSSASVVSYRLSLSHTETASHVSPPGQGELRFLCPPFRTILQHTLLKQSVPKFC